jgi:hypothetical protein
MSSKRTRNSKSHKPSSARLDDLTVGAARWEMTDEEMVSTLNRMRYRLFSYGLIQPKIGIEEVATGRNVLGLSLDEALALRDLADTHSMETTMLLFTATKEVIKFRGSELCVFAMAVEANIAAALA